MNETYMKHGITSKMTVRMRRGSTIGTHSSSDMMFPMISVSDNTDEALHRWWCEKKAARIIEPNQIEEINVISNTFKV